jgi:hypothetical protein
MEIYLIRIKSTRMRQVHKLIFKNRLYLIPNTSIFDRKLGFSSRTIYKKTFFGSFFSRVLMGFSIGTKMRKVE